MKGSWALLALGALSVLASPQLQPPHLQRRISDESSSTNNAIRVADASSLPDMLQRRVSVLIGSLGSANGVSTLLSSLNPSGQWPDVDYTTGCSARRSNWPASIHWERLVQLAGAWHGGMPDSADFVQNPNVQQAISRGMDWWFSRDFTNDACLDSGSTPTCPCNPADDTMWNANWFASVILVPDLVGKACLLFNSSLTPAQFEGCKHMTSRAYGVIDKNVNGLGIADGANLLGIARIGVDLGLFTSDSGVIGDAYNRVHTQLAVQTATKSDGIRQDGGFSQHGGLLYNGNYGKDFSNAFLDLEVVAGGTQFSADAAQQSTFEKMFDGNKWMIITNTVTGVLHWDFSAIGRFISEPVADGQASASINMNLTEVGALGEMWSSSTLSDFASSLSGTTSSSANAGDLLGNRIFYDMDYMVHRGSNYVSSVKMYSKRTQSSECINSQNTKGFHLSDGALYTYLKGDEYEDIVAAWDWNLIPGITVDFGGTALNCDTAAFTGTQTFVGGVSTGNRGVAAMRYANPSTHALRFQKAWFFLDNDVQHIMVSNLSSTNSAPVYSVLDQKRHDGDILVDGTSAGTNTYPNAKTLWHAGVGYSFNPDSPVTLNVSVGQKNGNWADIGISTQPGAPVDLFAAWLVHNSLDKPIEYTAFPGVTSDAFAAKAQGLNIQTITNDAHVSAIYDPANAVVMAVFWDAAGGSFQFTPSGKLAVTVSSSAGATVMYNLKSGDLAVSDPSQTNPSLSVKIADKTLSFDLGADPGASVVQNVGGNTGGKNGAASRKTHILCCMALLWASAAIMMLLI
ncbi:polysaccharide lyase family 8 protein [Mycena floridula]|nr:polysaccharide lyase family 8 protein [Mycena floridula]